MDESLEQAAADLFATPFTAFRQITLPLIAPAILAGGLLAFTFGLDNVIISDFVKSPGTNTFPTYVFGLAKTRDEARGGVDGDRADRRHPVLARWSRR